MKFYPVVACFLIAAVASAQVSEEGSVRGVVVDQGSDQPIEYAAVVVKHPADGRSVKSSATDAKGAFEVGNIPFGTYQLSYGLVGAEIQGKTTFTVDAQHRAVDLGKLALGKEGTGTVKLEKLEVSARKEAFYNSIDRKVYNVGKDIQSASGSASSLLANIPSVQVDIEGNVALRGDESVLILVNGKTSPMMGRNRAAVLEQMPADGIEKIEVITNPSAKYKPDGTAGIINIVLKKKREAGYSGSVRAMMGNDRRYSAGVTANYNPGKYNLYASASVRQDDRPRTVREERAHPDATNTLVATTQVTTEKGRPLSRLAQIGVDYKFDDRTTIGITADYNTRDFVRQTALASFTRLGSTVTKDYDRFRTAPEYEKDLEFSATLQHAFPQEDRELGVEVQHGTSTEEEDNRYANVYRTPALATTFENTLIKTDESDTEFIVDYTHPIGENAKLELGYNGEWNKVDADFRGSAFDAIAQAWVVDATKTNRFIYDDAVHAFYGTYARKFGDFGAQAGLRFETVAIHTHQVTAQRRDRNDYDNLYPSLHLTYDVSEMNQLQLNYSHRVERPDGDDLNPFPQYDDPFNLRIGNPQLQPEEAHSVEAGYQYKNNDATYLATVYYRHRYNGMTDVRRFVDSGTLLPDPSGVTLLTTRENLGTSRSGGLELVATTRWKEAVAINFSANVYRNEIDASNIGFNQRRSTTAWDAKLNVNWDASKNTLVQFNTNYTAKRLTPQGYRYPTYFANLGLRHNLRDKRTALVVSVSDLFNSLKERTHVDTPVLRQDVTRRRSSRIIYVGFIYNFGKPTKAKDDLQYDTAL